MFREYRFDLIASYPVEAICKKIHEAWTFGGLGKHAQSLSDIKKIFNTGPYRTPTPLIIKISKIGLHLAEVYILLILTHTDS